ncbi:MAG: hypothetical protein JW909_09675 [Planctomycetes bacterium]|nr:hypothetical protein [Planctomycetota bacterium]
MLLLKPLRKLARWLRGGAGGRELFLGAFLGLALGMMPGFNFTLLAGLLVLLVLNANIGVAVPSYGLGKAAAILLAPYTFQAGYFIIHRMGMERLFARLFQTPVVALMGLDKYCFTGAIPFIVVAGVIFGVLLARLVTSLRSGLLDSAARHPFLKSCSRNVIVRALLRIFCGPDRLAHEDAPAAASAPVQGKKSPFFRSWGLGLAVLVLLAVLGLEFVFLNFFFKSSLQQVCGAVVGAEVNIESASLSLSSGRLEIAGLQVTDPARPTHNLVQVSSLAADISVSDLLAGRFVIDEVSGGGVRCGSERAEPGAVYRKVPPPEEEAPGKDSSILSFFENTDRALEYLNRARDLLNRFSGSGPEPVEAQGPPKSEAPEQFSVEALEYMGRTDGYARLSAAASLTRNPDILIHQLTLTDVVLDKAWGPQTIQGYEISSHPALVNLPMRIIVGAADDAPPIAAAAFNFYVPDMMHEIELNLPAVALGGSVRLGARSPLRVHGGSAAVSARGEFNGASVNVPFTVHLTGLRTEVLDGRSVLGMDNDTARKVFSGLTELKVSGVLKGRLPFVFPDLDEKQILSDLAASAGKAGEAELRRRIDEEKDRLENKARDEVNKLIEDKAPDKLKDALKGLFNR